MPLKMGVPLIIGTLSIAAGYAVLRTGSYGYFLAFVLGLCANPFLTFYGKHKNNKGLQNFVYSLDHARLNLALPLKSSMWMNMGYWKDTVEFPKAAEALLDQILKAARLDRGIPFTLLDLGFGCGDQAMYLAKQLTPAPEHLPDSAISKDAFEVPLLTKYVGITIDESQFRYAETRLMSSNVSEGSRVQVFCADAAKPESWSAQLKTQVESLSTLGTEKESAQQWVLALDTACHFTPSRLPILTYACEKLNASFMAFDLILSQDASMFSRCVLSLMGVLMDCPYNTFKTSIEYRKMLVAAGYEDSQIEMTDITEHVFAPLAKFLGEQEEALEGIGWGLGKWKAAKWTFGWWARSGCLRGVIVVARKRRHDV